jgi:rSAM-associated Gly-rich repeat protein
MKSHNDIQGEIKLAQDRRSLSILAALLPAGALGLSIGLASADAAAATTADPGAANIGEPRSVASRLQAIRDSVSIVLKASPKDSEDPSATAAETQLAWWGNGGWRNGGWRNGGWGNGGWHNGGWGNGWHNGWHNW